MAGARALGESGGGGIAAMDYSVHEAWNEATNIYLLAVLASLALLVYARRNKRKIMRIFTLPPTVEISSEPNFYDSMKKVRLRQQLEMYSIEFLLYLYLQYLAFCVCLIIGLFGSDYCLRLVNDDKTLKTISRDYEQLGMKVKEMCLAGVLTPSEARKYDHQQQPQKQTDSVQLLVE